MSVVATASRIASHELVSMAWTRLPRPNFVRIFSTNWRAGTPALGAALRNAARSPIDGLLSLVSGWPMRTITTRSVDEQFAKVQIWRRFEQAAHGEIEIARFDELEQLGVEADVKLNLRGRALHDEAREDRLASPGAPGCARRRSGPCRSCRPPSCSTSRSASSSVIRAFSARARRAAPIGVNSTPRGARSNSRAPKCASSRCKLRVSAGWVMPRRFRRAREIPRLADGEEILEFPVKQRHARKLSQ